MKICFIGNSHLASLKHAWDIIARENADLEVSFFGSPANTLFGIRADGDRLVSGTDQLTKFLTDLWGKTALRPDDYDVICAVGLGVGWRTLGRLYRHFRSDVHGNRSGRYQLLTVPCFHEAAMGSFTQTPVLHVLKTLREVTHRPVLFMPEPMPVADAPLIERAVEAGDDVLLVPLMEEFSRQLEATAHVPRPQSTAAGPLSTKPEYGRGSKRLTNEGEEHDEKDYVHLNAQYGILAISEVKKAAAALGGLSAASTPNSATAVA